MRYTAMNTKEVLKHYIIAALWSSTDDDGNPLDERYDSDDLSPDTLTEMYEDVTKFVAEYHEALETWAGETTIEEQAGHDFWLTRNHHGVGFWEPEWGSVGKVLDNATKDFGEVNLYVGDDGLIYQE